MRRILVPLRVLLSGALLAVLIWRAHPAAVWAAWRSVNIWLLALAAVLQFAGVALSAAKWGLLLRARGQRLPFRFLLGNYLAGQFANNFLPTTVGGDALRVAQLGRRIGSYSQASASVFLERLTGFLALSLIACAALLLSAIPGAAFGGDPRLEAVAAGFTLLALLVFAASFGAARLGDALVPWLPGAARGPVRRVATALHSYAPRGWFLVWVMLLSFAFQGIWIGVHVACGLALGLAVPLPLFMLMVPLVDILGLAPIFFNNLGVREAVFGVYLAQVGIPEGQAIALALLVFSARLLISIMGGLVLLFGGADFQTRLAAPAATELAPPPS
jgi:uncharacterized membrane protein YbhN (UPF0104 family)